MLLVTLAAIGASVLLLQLRSPSYEATADILVEPLPLGDQVFTGLPMVRDTGDPVRTVQTAAALVDSNAAAERASQSVGREVGGSIEVNPMGESNILAVSATAESSEEATRMANEFARAALEVRDEELVELAGVLRDELETRLGAIPDTDPETRATLAARIDQISSVEETGDPTLTLSQPAVPPTSAEGPPGVLIIFLAAIVGFALGTGAAIVLELLGRRVRDAAEVVQAYPLPVLARVPLVTSRKLRASPRSTREAPEIREPFRTLAVQLEEKDGPKGAVMVTSGTSGDGKTTSAINLAESLAAWGKQVVLLDFDLRHPRVSIALGGFSRGHNLAALADPTVDVGSLLVPAADLAGLDPPGSRHRSRGGEHGSLMVLPLIAQPEQDGWVEVVGTRLPEFLRQARELADWVVVDTAPLGAVGDALRLARQVDDILIVVRPGNTMRGDLDVMGELLGQIGRTPTGYIVIGEVDSSGGHYYTYGAARRRVAQG